MTSNIREMLAERFDRVTLPKAKELATFIRQRDKHGRLPCWGTITDRFDNDFTSDESRMEIWKSLVDAGEKRTLLLYIHACRARPTVIEDVLKDAESLPEVVQRALISIEELEDQIKPHLSKFKPAAQQIAESDPDTKRRERQATQVRISKLMALRFASTERQDPDRRERF
ncbi:MAG: hypothetical protein GY847_17945 [Proteobacteria bacterium]|nr:hypothetical protein [Pseudomonadota bacterium]